MVTPGADEAGLLRAMRASELEGKWPAAAAHSAINVYVSSALSGALIRQQPFRVKPEETVWDLKWLIKKYANAKPSQMQLLLNLSTLDNKSAIRDLPLVSGAVWLGLIQSPRGCASCGKQSDNLKQCRGCHAVHYCSETCQRHHWREHRTVCQSCRQPKGTVNVLFPDGVCLQMAFSLDTTVRSLRHQVAKQRGALFKKSLLVSLDRQLWLKDAMRLAELVDTEMDGSELMLLVMPKLDKHSEAVVDKYSLQVPGLVAKRPVSKLPPGSRRERSHSMPGQSKARAHLFDLVHSLHSSASV